MPEAQDRPASPDEEASNDRAAAAEMEIDETVNSQVPRFDYPADLRDGFNAIEAGDYDLADKLFQQALVSGPHTHRRAVTDYVMLI